MTFSEVAPSVEGSIEAVYQPIVDLTTEKVVGYEALARWTATRRTVGPRFGGSEDVVGLDWACRTAALAGALDGGLDHETPLFVNVEPRVLDLGAPPAFAEVFRRARRHLQLVVELTERDLLARPRELLDFADRMRALGWRLALDDVGAHTESLAALPFLDPEIIKLDISLVQNDPTPEQARTLTGILAHSERAGTTVLAEGIETEAHLERARTLGAALGQGYLFGRPAPLPSFPARRPTPLQVAGRWQQTPAAVPASALDSSPSVRVARTPVLQKLSRQLEQQGLNQADPSVLLATFQDVERLGSVTGERFGLLAKVCRFVGVLGVGMPLEPLPGVRGASLEPDDPLTAEWTVVVVGAHYAGALIAREVDPGRPVADCDRRFAFILTHDRETVVAAGRQLLRRFGAGPV